MASLAEIMQVIVPSVVVPAGVFGGNWAIRYRSDYTQTAASDFILAVLIFDGAVITTSKEFEHLIRSEEFRHLILHWHAVFFLIGCGLWWLIATFAEPLIAEYYAPPRG